MTTTIPAHAHRHLDTLHHQDGVERPVLYTTYLMDGYPPLKVTVYEHEADCWRVVATLDRFNGDNHPRSHRHPHPRGRQRRNLRRPVRRHRRRHPRPRPSQPGDRLMLDLALFDLGAALTFTGAITPLTATAWWHRHTLAAWIGDRL